MKIVRRIGYATLALFLLSYASLNILLTPAGMNFALAQTSQGMQIPSGSVINGQIGKAGTIPTVTNATMSLGSTDTMGSFTLAGASSPVMTFAVARKRLAVCIAVNNSSTSNGFTYTVSLTAITFVASTSGAGQIVTYVCI